ncbi:glycosyltransferase family 39 protein [Siculibacillus lacustris]|uniref:Glycosyltransferase family 39 protein n=1 Tax=Siculibacillus lacustris TaxID=1549641 RepID=A0A4Q9VYU2_9HYPH|nr:glycosyltransferase family 39 protein [Siculibacillus lacustris]TBW41371.1 glycosyltransferase family 39 protein [Siculibacillus lacustris]
MTDFSLCPPLRVSRSTEFGDTARFLVFLTAYVAVFTLFATLSHDNLSTSTNMVENWVWGKEFQLGYFKHPPLFAWVVGAWFQVFPRADWAYYLLAETSVAVGLAGTWMTIGCRETGSRRLVATAILVLSPLYGFHALKFNANTISIATWPWAMWAFLKALESPSARNGLRLGAFLAIAMLGKYYTATLVLAMLAVVATEPDRRRLLRSPAALTATVTGLLLISPNLAWVVASDFEPFVYAGHARNDGVARTLASIATFPIAEFLFLLPVGIGAVVALGLRRSRALLGVLRIDRGDPWRRRILILALGPFVATMILGLLAFSRLPALWGEPLWMLTGWALLTAPGVTVSDVDRARVMGVLAALGAILVAAAPFLNAAEVAAGNEEATLPLAEVAEAATAVWRQTVSDAPLAIVTGDELLAGSIAFYGPSAPSELQTFDFGHSPWIDAARIAREGALAVCRVTDEPCLDSARTLFGPAAIEATAAVSKVWRATPLAPLEVRFVMRLPDAVAGTDPQRRSAEIEDDRAEEIMR